MEDALSKLRHVLSSLRQESVSGHHFVPYQRLKAEVTEDLVADAIAQFYHPKHHGSRVVHTVLQDGLRVFCILVWLHSEQMLVDFIERNILDSRLPMVADPVSVGFDIRWPLKRFSNEVQWEYLPHIFGKDDYHRKIHDREILPFINETVLAEGASGVIYKTTIALSHQTLLPEKDGKPVVVIRKQLKINIMVSDEKYLERCKSERECLDFLRHIRNDNIIELLGSYVHRGQHNLLFPLLPMDLAEFLGRTERFGNFKNNITFYSALDGLASAIKCVHQATIAASGREKSLFRIGYHHDIRPKNVLVTESTFILADFGLARLKPADEDSKTVWKSGIGDYIAPECMDEAFNHQETGRSIDIWSLGCLVSEVATYMEGGPVHVEEFRKERTQVDHSTNWTDHYFFGKGELKESVSRWFAALSADPKDRGVQLLIRTANMMFHQKRPKADIVSIAVSYVHIKALFRTSSEILLQVGNTRDDGNEDMSPYDRLDLWFEAERFRAWGVVLGMYNDEISCRLLEGNALLAVPIRSILEKLCTRLEQSDSNEPDTGRDPTSMTMPCESTSKTLSSQVIEVSDLRSLVQDLWQVVPRVYQKRMEQVWRQSSLQSDDTNRLRQIEDGTVMLDHTYSEIGALAVLKRLEQEVWSQQKAASPNQKHLILGDFQIEKRVNLDVNHELGWYRPTPTRSQSPWYLVSTSPQRVLVEWILYSLSWNKQTSEEKVLRVAALAELLHHPKPKGFQVFDCIGFIPPSTTSLHEGFGFVYSIPPNIGDEKEPKTLHQLLNDEAGYTPLLEEKFAIASALTSSIFELHSSGWLHKNIQSQNLMLFLEGSDRSEGGNQKIAGGPFLIGFLHSRPDDEVWYSSKKTLNEASSGYEHPAYSDETRFRKWFDYYSVGVVLLELGFWKPISSFRNQHRGEDKEKFRKTLIKRYVPKLGQKMGSLYQTVVLACLRGEFVKAMEEPEVEDEVAKFYWNVVAKLAECNVG